MEKNYTQDMASGEIVREKYNYRPTQWWSLYKTDIARYKYHTHLPAIACFILEQGLWALLYYRLSSAVYRSSLPRLIKSPLLVLALIWLKVLQITTGITINYRATIGAGFYIGHYGSIFINGEAVIGHTCNISQGVSIGISGRGAKRGVPRIGNRVLISPGAIVAGKITIGDDALIAANSLVISDVAPHTTVIGVPAEFKNNYGSEMYIGSEE